MPKADLTRVTITWSRDTDRALRSYLGRKGVKKGALSRFIEDAVKWRLFDHTVNEVRVGFADLPADDLSKMIDKAVTSIRKSKRRG